MLFMNHYEIENAVGRYADDPVLGPASRTLANLMEWTNRNSDGWAYWPKPCRAAAKLQALFPRRWDDERPTVEQYKAALVPIKAFRTRQGADFVIEEARAVDSHGNAIAREGCDRCSCGCKYWEHDRCIDCGTHVSKVTA